MSRFQEIGKGYCRRCDTTHNRTHCPDCGLPLIPATVTRSGEASNSNACGDSAASESPASPRAAGTGRGERCQQSTRYHGQCCDVARWLSPTGLKVCGTHRRWIDIDNDRRDTGKACTPLSDEPVSEGKVMFTPRTDYGDAHPDNGTLGEPCFYFAVASAGDDISRLSGYLSREQFDWVAERLGLPKLEPIDPTPYCSYGHPTKASCDCLPIAENE